MYEARLRAPHGSGTEMRELLGGTKENFISLDSTMLLVVPYLDDPSDAAAAVQAFNFELRTAICL